MFTDEVLNDGDGDAAILAKFREWRAACEAVDRASKTAPDDDPAWLALIDHADELAEEIAYLPAAGTTGLAVKLFLAVRQTNGGRYGCHAALPDLFDGEEGYASAPVIEGCIRDAARVCPELAPLCAAFLDAESQP